MKRRSQPKTKTLKARSYSDKIAERNEKLRESNKKHTDEGHDHAVN